MQDLCGLNIANSSTITVCIVQTEKIEFPAYASPSPSPAAAIWNSERLTLQKPE